MPIIPHPGAGHRPLKRRCIACFMPLDAWRSSYHAHLCDGCAERAANVPRRFEMERPPHEAQILVWNPNAGQWCAAQFIEHFDGDHWVIYADNPDRRDLVTPTMVWCNYPPAPPRGL